jgi:hypothetical protein
VSSWSSLGWPVRAYTANTTTGVISSAAAAATQIFVGFTVEATRLDRGGVPMNLVTMPYPAWQRSSWKTMEEHGQSIEGHDKGTNEFADVITQSIDGADLNAMWREFQRSTNMLNDQRDPLINRMTFDGDQEPTERVMLAGERGLRAGN